MIFNCSANLSSKLVDLGVILLLLFILKHKRVETNPEIIAISVIQFPCKF